MLVLLYGCTIWTQPKRMKRKVDGNYTTMLRNFLKQILEAALHETAAEQPLASHFSYYPRKTNETYSDLLGRQK